MPKSILILWLTELQTAKTHKRMLFDYLLNTILKMSSLGSNKVEYNVVKLCYFLIKKERK